MKSPSNKTLRRYYHRINNVAFNGKLNPRIKFISWDRVNWRSSRRSKNIDAISDSSWGVEVISINFDRHETRCQWTLTLIHEMVHQLFPPRVDCKGKKFQTLCFEVMIKMGWGLM